MKRTLKRLILGSFLILDASASSYFIHHPTTWMPTAVVYILIGIAMFLVWLLASVEE